MTGHPSSVYAAALSGLPDMTAARAVRLLRDRSAGEVWQLILAGRVGRAIAPAAVAAAWRDRAERTDLVALGCRLADAGVAVSAFGEPAHVECLAEPPGPAGVLFSRGDREAVDGPRVGIVGTRRCSALGREIATELGAGLSAAGVRVVSGLALGIDGAAHRGALNAGGAPPIGVVASGLDVVYPRRHHELWRRVGEQGLLLSEAPLGTPPQQWAFPLRNRLIAALSHLVVVVESRARGGSMHTVRQAERRGVDVMAVPGSVRNGAAVGTNDLIAEGCAPVRDVADVVTALGLTAAGAMVTPAARPALPHILPRTQAGDDHRQVVEALDGVPVPLDTLAARLGRDVPTLLAAVDALAGAGTVRLIDGWVHPGE